MKWASILQNLRKLVRNSRYIILVLCFISILAGFGQAEFSSVCHIENDRLVFMLDVRWTAEQKKKVSQQFSLDSAVMSDAFAMKPVFTNKGIEWKTRKTNPNIIELSKSLINPKSQGKVSDDVIMMDDAWLTSIEPEGRQSVRYGVNKFTRYTSFIYQNGIARFYLPGYTNAENVVLAGTFNNWSTSQLQMMKSDSGWTVRIKLNPGRYSYKFIVDGKWMSDPFNHQKEHDGYGRFNSVVFCFNHTFLLRGHIDAKQVILSGSFNGWNKKELKMIRIPSGWAILMYLREGTHAYKFVVDDVWIADPASKTNRPDGFGGYNSYVGIGDSIIFHLKGYPDSKEVFLAGNFNGWNSRELKMDKVADGWELPYILSAGNYEYKFIVDDQWIIDPENPVRSGTGKTTNAIKTVKPNHTFTLDNYPDAKSVFVTGTFNGWMTDGYSMIKKDGRWKLPLCLKPGKQLYKFIVDGKWIVDPDNELWEENEFGSGNSILWVNP
jgi:hypothetical protein